MLDFLLVLGLVPGTNFQITFAELVAIYITVPLLWAVRKQILHIYPRRTANNMLIYMQFRKGQQLRLPLRQTRHIVSGLRADVFSRWLDQVSYLVLLLERRIGPVG